MIANGICLVIFGAVFAFMVYDSAKYGIMSKFCIVVFSLIATANVGFGVLFVIFGIWG